MSGKLRIVLADDSRFFRAIEAQFLRKIPVEIFETGSCEETMAVVRDKSPDLVYLAFSLPPKDGAACCRLIKSDPELASIPVVIVCDKDQPLQAKEALQSGCDTCLFKPLDRQSFLQPGWEFLSGIREPRQPSFFPVFFSVGGESYQGKSLDISGGGMFIESKANLPAGTRLKLVFKLPDELQTEIHCEAEISWPNDRANPLKLHYPDGFGVKFLDMTPESYKAILRLTNKNPLA